MLHASTQLRLADACAEWPEHLRKLIQTCDGTHSPIVAYTSVTVSKQLRLGFGEVEGIYLPAVIQVTF